MLARARRQLDVEPSSIEDDWGNSLLLFVKPSQIHQKKECVFVCVRLLTSAAQYKRIAIPGMMNGEALHGNSNGHVETQSDPPPLPSDAPPVPAEPPAEEPGVPPLPQDPAGTSGNAPDIDPLLAAEAAGEEEPGPSGSVEAMASGRRQPCQQRRSSAS